MKRNQLILIAMCVVGAYAATFLGMGALAFVALLPLLGTTVVDTIQQDSTPSDHLKRSVESRMIRKDPWRTPIDTLLREMRLSAAGRQEKEEFEEIDSMPRTSSVAGGITGGSASEVVAVTTGHGKYYRLWDAIYVPATGDVLRVTAITDDNVTVATYDGGNITANVGATAITRANNSKVEFFNASDPRGTMPANRFNYHQSFDGTIKASSRRIATMNHTGQHDWARNRDEQIVDFRRSINNAIWVMKKSKTTLAGGENLTTFDGVIAQVSKSGGYTASTFSEGDIVDLHRQLFVGNSGSNTRFHFCGSLQAQDYSLVGLDKVRRTQVDSKHLKIQTEAFTSVFGTTIMIYDPSLDELGLSSGGWILDLANLRKVTLEPMRATRLHLREQGVAGEGIWVTETFCPQLYYLDTHMKITRTP